jgi:hypothetical protein
MCFIGIGHLPFPIGDSRVTDECSDCQDADHTLAPNDASMKLARDNLTCEFHHTEIDIDVHLRPGMRSVQLKERDPA